ncbi:MAG: aminotransferase class I/II-fold pyridoxal phosphate-dependent enzyme [Spirochaetaceae bacterium]|jgi:aspartate/methionine/tyrosine aminotransferase|nr:aminotransferase class I/II-fold pyridoxal phosphate-dependent enzyme [Spirochaetaceae bacterium]
MNDLAQELNSILEATVAGRLLSDLGRRLYFPKGIIAQSVEAKKNAHMANATIGMAYQNDSLMILSALQQPLAALSPEAIVAYAPTAGLEKTRQLWQKLLTEKNPSLDPNRISLPVLVPGLTAGISYCADLFFDPCSSLCISQPCWDNYELIFEQRRGASLVKIPFFEAGDGLDFAGIEKALQTRAQKEPLRLMLNFPHNPSGYTLTRSEAEQLIVLLKAIADAGSDVLVLCDDSYFGLFYEPDCMQESLFSQLSSLHDRILAIKIDGPTKEDFAWGLRLGFVTFGSKSLEPAHYDALIKKLMGAIRSSVSCANTPAQSLLLHCAADPRTPLEKAQYYAVLKSRYHFIKHFIDSNPPHPRLKALPFNSGYFMTFRCMGINAELLRQELLDRHGVGTIAFGSDYLRVAFSSVDQEHLEHLYRLIYETAAVL